MGDNAADHAKQTLIIGVHPGCTPEMIEEIRVASREFLPQYRVLVVAGVMSASVVE